MRDTISGTYPLLILYGQVYGALVKTWVLFRPDYQGWSRQPVAVAPSAGWADSLNRLGSHLTYAVAMLALVTGIAFATGLLLPPSLESVAITLARLL